MPRLEMWPFQSQKPEHKAPIHPAGFEILLLNSFKCKRLLLSTLCIFSNFRHKQQRGLAWQPPLTLLIKIERTEVGKAVGTVGVLWISCLAWVFLTLSAYFGEGCLSGELRAGFSGDLSSLAPWPLPFWAQDTSLWLCV